MIVAASLIALAGCSRSAEHNGGQQAQGTQSGIDKSAMDTSAKPGDDFDEYANGTWQKNAQIPADKSNISVFSAINDQSRERATDLVDAIVKSNPASGDDARIANFYKAYADTNGIEKRGVAPIRADVDRIEAIADKSGSPKPSATRCAPTPTRSTIPISIPKICSGSSSLRLLTIPRRPSRT